ncbi:hypothetical protein KSC_105110 [Ktedonobacter sp. SOSP1-52]|nr:hypothetical protein KSC_105110 [Ktedonobacter sp. SOSP1-52]
MIEQNLFKWRHFQTDIILLCVRWYLRSALSYRDLEEIMLERGLHVDHTTIYRWVQSYAPELEKRCRPHLKACNDSWNVDETYIKIKNVWFYLYRAVDSEGNTLEFLLSPTRDTEAATRFFLKALRSTIDGTPHVHPVEEQKAQPTTATNLVTSVPRVINVDKNAAYPKAVANLKAAKVLSEHVELRQVKYLNNLIEQDHRAHQTVDQTWNGLFLLRDGLANLTRIRGDEHAEKRATARRGKRECERADSFPPIFATQPPYGSKGTAGDRGTGMSALVSALLLSRLVTH